MQLSAPALLVAYVPSPHVAGKAVRLPAGQVWRSGHASHAVAPSSAWKVPSEQTLHSWLLSPSAKLPALQLTGAIEPATHDAPSRAAEPSGDAMEPSGDAAAPSGDAAAPYGDAAAPSGDATAPSGDATASARGRTVGRFSHLRGDRHGSESSARAGRPYACRADLRRGIGCIHGGKGPSIQSSSAQRTAVARRLVGSRFSSRALPPYH